MFFLDRQLFLQHFIGFDSSDALQNTVFIIDEVAEFQITIFLYAFRLIPAILSLRVVILKKLSLITTLILFGQTKALLLER